MLLRLKMMSDGSPYIFVSRLRLRCLDSLSRMRKIHSELPVGRQCESRLQADSDGGSDSAHGQYLEAGMFLRSSEGVRETLGGGRSSDEGASGSSRTRLYHDYGRVLHRCGAIGCRLSARSIHGIGLSSGWAPLCENLVGTAMVRPYLRAVSEDITLRIC